MIKSTLKIGLLALALSGEAFASSAQERDLLAAIQKAAAAGNSAEVINLTASLKGLKALESEGDMDATESAAKEKEDFLEHMKKAGWSLSLAPGDDNPAKFAFSRDVEAGTDTVFTADFFLSWKTPNSFADSLGWRHKTWDMNAAASVQGKLTSASNTEHDAWRFRGTLNGRYTFNPTAAELDDINGFLWSLSVKDEASRDFDFNRLGAEGTLTPTIPALAMGVYKGDKDGVQFRWRPFIGFDAGTTTSDSITTTEANETLWLSARITAKAKLNFLAKALKMNEVSLYADDKLIHLSEAGVSRNYLKTGVNFMFNDHVGFSFDYSVGRDSPSFVKEESFTGAFTIGF